MFMHIVYLESFLSFSFGVNLDNRNRHSYKRVVLIKSVYTYNAKHEISLSRYSGKKKNIHSVPYLFQLLQSLHEKVLN